MRRIVRCSPKNGKDYSPLLLKEESHNNSEYRDRSQDKAFFVIGQNKSYFNFAKNNNVEISKNQY
jgi:hypothetical protein